MILWLSLENQFNSHDDHVLHIHAGLGPEYDPTVSILIKNDETPPLQRVYSMFLTQESRLQRHSTTDYDIEKEMFMVLWLLVGAHLGLDQCHFLMFEMIFFFQCSQGPQHKTYPMFLFSLFVL